MCGQRHPHGYSRDSGTDSSRTLGAETAESAGEGKTEKGNMPIEHASVVGLRWRALFSSATALPPPLPLVAVLCEPRLLQLHYKSNRETFLRE